MRDNYVGDLGDFYKYKLLRSLCGMTEQKGVTKRKLGVVWYLNTDSCKLSDGKHLSYLEKESEYHPQDPELFDKLKELIDDNVRTVTEIPKRGILPPDTVFFEEPLSLSHLPKGNPATTKQRLAHRQEWLKRVLAATKDCDIVFFDPDNGMEIKSVLKHRDKGPKFVFYDELLSFWNRGQSLVIYQHRTRQKKVEKQISERKEKLKNLGGNNALNSVKVHYYPNGSGRFFFIINKAPR